MYEPNWIIHCVQEEVCECCGKHEKHEDSAYRLTGFANIHTHGFKNNGHDEVCIVYNLNPDTAAIILNDIGFRIRERGEHFDEGFNDTLLQNNYDVKFYRSNGSKTLYLFLPDPNNKFPGDHDCAFPYNQQQLFADIIEEEEWYV